MKLEAMRKMAEIMRQEGVSEAKIIESMLTAATVERAPVGWHKITPEEFNGGFKQ